MTDQDSQHERSLHTAVSGNDQDEDDSARLIVQQALSVARRLQARASVLQTSAEKKQQHELARMMKSPHDKATLMQMTDQSLRAKGSRRVVDQLRHILDVQGIPGFFSPFDRTMLLGFQSFGSFLPTVTRPLVEAKMRQETVNVILPAEEKKLSKHLRTRQAAGLRMNVNILGETLLGERAASVRLKAYLAALQNPNIECLSIKISTLYSQISSLAREDTVETLCDRLEQLYREAARNRFCRADGSEVPKFVYLDMEEYRDLGITAAAFMRTLDRNGLAAMQSGIALQAYLPDAWEVQKEINAWACARVRAGGAPVTVRLVKGANMEMERVEASLHGWPQAPYRSKAEVDANYKRMLQEAMRPENLAAVRVGVASHNLFDVAYALVLAEQANAGDAVQFEMLEGMANHQRRALAELTGNLLLYAPASKHEDFVNAIGYLIRRLDENTGPDNFLAHAFKLAVDGPEWQALEDQFLASFRLIDQLPSAPRRNQDRRKPPGEPQPANATLESFGNEADTDFALPHNVAWAKSIIERWSPRYGPAAADIPLVIAGTDIVDDRAVSDCRDPSHPNRVVGRYRQAGRADIDNALRCAREDPGGWRSRSTLERSRILALVANGLRAARGDLIGAAIADGGKSISESDPEVSEAIDFVEYYRRSALHFTSLEGVTVQPKGVVAVIPPWNFPIAIPCGGIAAALAAGNCVILKPASDAVLVAWELCRVFWDAGVPREALQFTPCRGAEAGSALAAHADVDAVILTGGTETALAMLHARPDMTLLAETGGKNATVVTAMSDREQAIKNILHSAFGHGGQKCSATSLLILEDEVYDDEHFRDMLCDAVESLPVGPAWDRRTRVGPLIRPPSGALARAFAELDEGEEWAVTPRQDRLNPQLWSPGVKWGVGRRSFTHMTELFGPVLAVMRAQDLYHAIELINDTGYGLTAGLESLDDREQRIWQEYVEAGNLYINRPTTGAVVLRQPFGGFGKSAIGPGSKAGGPNYVAQLMDFADEPGHVGAAPENVTPDDDLLTDLYKRLSAGEAGRPEGLDRLLTAMASYADHQRREFALTHDHFRLLGQHNLRRYLPLKEMGALRIRAHRDDSFFDLFARVAAARTVGCRITVSRSPDDASAQLDELARLTESWGESIELLIETDEELAGVVRDGLTQRVRYAAPDRVPAAVLAAAAQSGCLIARPRVLAHGRLELLWYCREQSISDSYHRYGNLGERGSRDRAAVS